MVNRREMYGCLCARAHTSVLNLLLLLRHGHGGMAGKIEMWGKRNSRVILEQGEIIRRVERKRFTASGVYQLSFDLSCQARSMALLPVGHVIFRFSLSTVTILAASDARAT